MESSLVPPNSLGSKRRRRRRGATMEMNIFLLLPMEIAEDLFSRVPFDSILQCKVVCKSLRRLINNLSFVQEHHRSNMHQKGYLLRLCDIKPHKPGFYYGEYKEKEKVTRFNMTTEPVISHSITSHHHHCPFGDATQWCIVGSCKGLICLRNILHSKRGTGHDDMYVCNPYTNKYEKLPKSINDYFNPPLKKKGKKRPDQPHDVKIAYGFGYLRITGEYKVIRIYYHQFHKCKSSSSGYVEVYTLGSSTGWSPKGEIKHKLYREDEDEDGKKSQNNSYGVLVLGVLYWITKKQNLIISFDLAKEEFQVITLPPVEIVCLSVLAVLGGCLCLTVDDDDDDHTHIWVLSKKDCSCPWIDNKEYSCPWIEKNKKNYSCPWIENKKKNCSCRWIKKFSIPWKNKIYHYPLAELENGKILLHRNMEIVVYDPKTKSFVFRFSCKRTGIEKPIRFDVIPYAKSSVSLKALGRKKNITYGGAAAAVAARNRMEKSWFDFDRLR